MFVVSYVLIVAFHLHLNIKKIVVQRSCGHSINQLTTIDYLFDDQMKYVGVKLVKLLNDIAQEVSQQKKKKQKNSKCSRTNVLYCHSICQKSSASLV